MADLTFNVRIVRQLNGLSVGPARVETMTYAQLQRKIDPADFSYFMGGRSGIIRLDDEQPGLRDCCWIVGCHNSHRDLMDWSK